MNILRLFLEWINKLVFAPFFVLTIMNVTKAFPHIQMAYFQAKIGHLLLINYLTHFFIFEIIVIGYENEDNITLVFFLVSICNLNHYV
jgi:hypothetical protein